MQGWIKFHRQICDNELYFSERFTRMQAWIDLLLLATHKAQTVFLRGVEIHLSPGELCYSQLSLAKRWKWNFKTVKTFLSSLEKREMLECKTNNITTVISIRNWKKYQWDGEQTGDQNGEQKETRTETNKNEENVHNENTIKRDEVLFENELLKITANQLEELKRAYPAIKKLLPEFILCTDLMREKQRKGQVIGSPMAFLHSHLKREQEKLTTQIPKQAVQQGGARSGSILSLQELLGEIASHAEVESDNGRG